MLVSQVSRAVPPESGLHLRQTNEPEVKASRRGVLYPALFAVITAVIAIVASVSVATHRPVSPVAAVQVPALTVTFAAPRRVNWPVTLEASGAIAAWQEASIGTQIGGFQLIEVLVNVGDEVTKGQVLARFDPALLRADETQLKASHDQAEANLQRALTLKSRGFLSDKDALQSETDARTTGALLASKQLQLRYTEVVSPDDGPISSRTATLGAVVPNGQELFRLIRQNRIEWRGELTAAQLPQIEAGQRVALMLPDGSSTAATVRQTAPSLDPLSRLATVYADIEPGSHARAGMYANGKVTLAETRALAIPAESVVIRDGRNYVLKLAGVGDTPKVSLQAVTVGRRVGNEIEVTEGISNEDRVVVSGAGFLNDGDMVRVVGPSKAAHGNPAVRED